MGCGASQCHFKGAGNGNPPKTQSIPVSPDRAGFNLLPVAGRLDLASTGTGTTPNLADHESVLEGVTPSPESDELGPIKPTNVVIGQDAENLLKQTNTVIKPESGGKLRLPPIGVIDEIRIAKRSKGIRSRMIADGLDIDWVVSMDEKFAGTDIDWQQVMERARVAVGSFYFGEVFDCLHEWKQNYSEHKQKLLKGVKLFQTLGGPEIRAAAAVMERLEFQIGDRIIEQGDLGKDCYFLDSGEAFASIVLDSKEQMEVKQYGQGGFFGERALLRDEPRAASIFSRTVVVAFRLPRAAFVSIIRERDLKEKLIRSQTCFENCSVTEVAIIAGLLNRTKVKAGENIFTQGQIAQQIYVVETGEASGSDFMQTVELKYKFGSLIGEEALLGGTVEMTILAQTNMSMFTMTREDFEATIGASLTELKESQFLRDPRKIVADFYAPGDSRGPAGTLACRNLTPDLASGPSNWFVVYRPCSQDSVAKMLSRTGVGKGLNIKGKSALDNRLSGFVPFVQISNNDHKEFVEPSPAAARSRVYFQSASAQKAAHDTLFRALCSSSLAIDRPVIDLLDDYTPQVFGLDIPEPLLRQVYIIHPDISPMVGWETGRASEPSFMNDNLHSLREVSSPPVVLYQQDVADPMNPLGLLMAYAENEVQPVVSDMDAFVVGSKGMQYEETPAEQVELMKWCLGHLEEILSEQDSRTWQKRWIEVLQKEKESGVEEVVCPEYGFGDVTSHALTRDIVMAMATTGAVRHGAECFNFYHPQALDAEFLIIWDGFKHPPWRSVSEPQLREFLIKRVAESYTFPVHPLWPARDPGWFEVMDALNESKIAGQAMKSWFPPGSGVLEQILKIHEKHPDGFVILDDEADTKPQPPQKAPEAAQTGQEEPKTAALAPVANGAV